MGSLWCVTVVFGYDSVGGVVDIAPEDTLFFEVGEAIVVFVVVVIVYFVIIVDGSIAVAEHDVHVEFFCFPAVVVSMIMIMSLSMSIVPLIVVVVLS